MKNHTENIKALLAKSDFPIPVSIVPLPSSGSARIYHRINLEDGNSIIAAFNPDVSENIAWYSFSTHFKQIGLRVPEIYARDESYRYFLLQDLGDTNLFELVVVGVNDEVLKFYKEAITDLISFQIDGIKGLDLDVAYPVQSFDNRSIMWDLNYFKYYFIKPHELSFDESKLESDFEKFADLLLKADSNYFMFRDFQSRNIMVDKGDLWYIDFQGGRQGPLQYDLVSLLYQAKANISEETRNLLLEYYLSELGKRKSGNADDFTKYYPYFIYFRQMQVLGAYGFRGLVQRKGHFLNSIPFAINNLKQLQQWQSFGEEFSELDKVFKQIIDLDQYNSEVPSENKLNVNINSFSYKKKGYPYDRSENGGGFAFDCRALPNPGRIVDLRDFNGTQTQVIEYLESKSEVEIFLENIYRIVDQSVENYLDRGFSNLQVNFGCTGGKHRSVYCSEQLKKQLQKYGDKLKIEIHHLQKNDW